MSKKRKQYSSAFKSKVALAALKGEETTSQIAARFRVHPTMVSTWKRELQNNASDIFDTQCASSRKGANEPDADQLYREIGRLTVERDFCRASSISKTPTAIGDDRAQPPRG